MDIVTILTVGAIAWCSLVLGAVAAAEAALERANDVRIQALAARGTARPGESRAISTSRGASSGP
ncbi:MAG: hypothetical protein IPI85_10170 [Dehalococcoidia bacterium]|nr:hypothetical protein [Dehalococcoidia bacterium]